jgi:hypothetical protein
LIDDFRAGIIQDNFTSPGASQNAYSGDVTVEVLWAPTGVADPYSAGSSASTGGATVQTDITALLGAGWTLAQNYNSGIGTAATGPAMTTAYGATATTKNAGGVATYNGTDPFEVSATSIYGGNSSGEDIQLIFIALDGADTSYTSATALGISNPVLNEVGSAFTDPNSYFVQSTDSNESTGGTAGPGQFFVDPVLGVGGPGPVPEPTTLALAGLGGFSMLFFRRRKA